MILLRPHLAPLVWIVSAITILFPSYYFPYERSSLAGLAIFLMVATGMVSYLLGRHLVDKYSFIEPGKGDLRFPSKYFKVFVVLVCLYILYFNVSGFLMLQDTVFSSKKVLDNASFTKWPVNFKILSGLLLGLYFKEMRLLFWFHFIVSAQFSFLFAERLHLMEFLVAYFVGRMACKPVRISIRTATLISVSFTVLFMVFEATRNFYVIYFVKGDGITLTNAIYNLAERFAAYYGDTTNKYALTLEYYDNDFLPFHYVLWLKTQITKNNEWFSGETIGNMADGMGYSYENLTNIGSFALLNSDVGVLSLFLAVWFGILPVIFFNRFLKSASLVYGVLTVIFLINCLEFSRIFYVFNLRGWMSLLPCFIFLFVAQTFGKKV